MKEWAELILAMATLCGSLGALIASLHNAAKIQEVHLDINSRMTELLRITGAEARAAGMEEERIKANSKLNPET